MDQPTSEYILLCAQLYRLNDAYTFLHNLKNRDTFEDEELAYTKKQQWIVKADIKKLEKKNTKEIN
jgi:hypothetical protein